MEAPHLGDLQVSCLLYADDLVLLSETKEGLQNSLNALEKFTKDWFMEVNPKKTKCLEFARGGKRQEIHKHKFKLGEVTIDNCEEYCYLGVVFVRTGSLKTASKALHDKAQGAMFSLLRDINKHHACKFNVLLDLFDKMIVPISIYNSEVWGINSLPANTSNTNLLDTKVLLKLPIEGLQLRFLKMILGVSKRTSNWAVLSETGSVPMSLKIFQGMIRFYFHLINTPSTLLFAALSTNARLAKEGNNTWFRALERILKFLDIEHILYTSDIKEVEYQISILKKTLFNKFVKHWEKERMDLINQSSKLDIFHQVKTEFCTSKYLGEPLFPSHRIALSRIRLSDHKFPIETGRYDNTSREQRVCPFGCGCIGNEYHYLFECTQPFIKKAREECERGEEPMISAGPMNNEQTLIDLLKSTDPETIRQSGKVNSRIQTIFKELMG